MPFKINIADKSGKTYKLETESEELVGKELKDKIEGKILMPELEGYEFEIAGASDKSGFTLHEDVAGVGLKRVLLTYGKGLKKRPRREGKKKVSNPQPKGLRMRKTVRGRVISEDVSQINLKVLKEGSKKLEEVFADQNKPKEEAKPDGEAPAESAEAPKEAAPAEEKKEEAKPEEEKKE